MIDLKVIGGKMKKLKTGFLRILIISTVLFVGMLTGLVLADGPDLYFQIRKNIGLFGRVYREITAKYVDEVDPEDFLRAGIEGMLATLDPYTVYFDKKAGENLKIMTTGKYGGLGIQIGIRGKDKVLTVIAPIEGTPAARLGIHAGDRIIEIEGNSTKGYSLEKTVSLLRGKPGTKVTITISRAGVSEPLHFTITREEITVKDVPYYGFIEDGIGYIKLSRFSKNAGSELERAIKDLHGKGLEGLILDLRSNPGGLLQAAVEVSDKLVKKEGLIVSTKGRMAGANQEYRAVEDPVLGEIPLVVLVNGGSASASEIVAGAVQDLDRGVVIGTPTFGKGLVQTVIALDRENSLKITTAKYYTPSGRLIQRVDYFNHEDAQSPLVSGEGEPGEREEFETASGRAVYGEGGIEPDIEVEVPRPDRLGIELWRQGMFFNFAVDFFSRHPDLDTVIVDDSVVEDFKEYLQKVEFTYKIEGMKELEDLKKKVEDKHYGPDVLTEIDKLRGMLEAEKDGDFDKSRQYIQHGLEAEIADKLSGPAGRYQASFKWDPQVIRAVGVLQKPDVYQKVLLGMK